MTSGLDIVDSDFEAQDEHGHGTVVADILGGADFGVAKGVSLVAVRVLDRYGYGTSAWVAEGVDWVTDNAIKPAVVNMSLGVGTTDHVINAAVSQSINSGLTHVVASGNWNIDACYFSPAQVPEAITVNASTQTDARASFSNYGSCSDIFAPGR